MLQPKREKYRKQHPGRRTGIARRGTRITFGEFGMKAMTGGWVTSRQIEAARVAITRLWRRTRLPFQRSRKTLDSLFPTETGHQEGG